MFAFLAMAWWPEHPASEETAQQLDAALHNHLGAGLPATRHDGFLFAPLGPDARRGQILPVEPSGDVKTGLLYGSVFQRSEGREPSPPLTCLPESVGVELAKTRGKAAYSRLWGSYVAFLKTPGSLLILTDPAASVPCHYMQYRDVLCVFSHLELCPFLPVSHLTFNRRFLSSLIVYDKIPSRETGFKEISRLMGGERLTATHATRTTCRLWDPSGFARSPSKASEPELAHALRAECRSTARALAQPFDEVSVSLSGGLDSSIVLSCLSGQPAPPSLDAFHNQLKSADPSEARFAADTAAFLGVDLTIRETDPHTALADPSSHPLSARPSRHFTQVHLPGPEKDADRALARAIFTGQGGDHVFLSRTTPLTLADHVQLNGANGQLLQQALHACRLSGLSLRRVVVSATAALLKDTGHDVIDAAIAHRAAALLELGFPADSLATAETRPPSSREGIAPLKFLQMSSLVHAFQANDPVIDDSPPLIEPLLSQPVIELCLQIPTPVLCFGGVNRGLARKAFAQDIPDTVRSRTLKGSASDFFTRYMSYNFARLDACLRGGELVRLALIPESSMDRLLDEVGAGTRYAGRLLLLLYGIEAWLRAWSRRFAEDSPAINRD